MFPRLHVLNWPGEYELDTCEVRVFGETLNTAYNKNFRVWVRVGYFLIKCQNPIPLFLTTFHIKVSQNSSLSRAKFEMIAKVFNDFERQG